MCECVCVCVMYSFFSLFPFFDLEVISLVFNIYQQLNLKNNLSEQEEQRQNPGYGERFGGCQMGEGRWDSVRIGGYRTAMGM